MAEVLREKIINGRKVLEFVPDVKMQLFGYAMSFDPKYVGRDPEDVLSELGMRRDQFTRWQRDFDPHFSEWLEGVITSFRSANVKKLIEFVGLQKAFAGEFNFWKAFALREKVITPDQMNVGLIPATLGVYSEWNDAQVEQHCNTLLEALRGDQDPGVVELQPVAEQRGDVVVAEVVRGGSEDSSCRAAPLPEESLALDEGVGVDGERAPFECEPF